jgi:predicted transcriptional regulator
MVRGATALSVLALATVVPAPARVQDVPPSDVVEFSLEETSGQTRTMSAVRGRVVVLFYEDREHTETNREFKLLLHRYILDNHLEAQTTTYAVANVGSIGDGVVRDLARTAIRAVASQYGIQILLDWDGILQAAPFSLRDRDANLALVDRQGRIRWRHAGPVADAQRRSFFAMLRRLLRETP